uniref:RdRp n=1 Tax=viral metagenome TaxID=1070528 RepID=A0A2V0RKH1_9ZZZZ
MIRALFPPGDEWDYRILHEMAHTILKTIILPGGWVYRCSYGNWSGPWTSILDSFSNWVAMSGALTHLKLRPQDVDLWIYGDDTLLGFRDGMCPKGLTPPDVQAILRDRYGIHPGDWNVGHLSSYGSGQGTTFLGCWNRDGLHGRPLSKWVDISVLPEKPRGGIGHQMKRMRYLTHAAVASKDNEQYFTDFFLWLNRQLPEPLQTPEPKLRQSLRNTFVKSHANFSSGGVDWRDWEYGAKQTLCELKRKCRTYQSELLRREVRGRASLDKEYRKQKWLRTRVRGVPISICGIEREDVAALVADWPAAAL